MKKDCSKLYAKIRIFVFCIATKFLIDSLYIFPCKQLQYNRVLRSVFVA